jgi:hypothetical protein
MPRGLQAVHAWEPNVHDHQHRSPVLDQGQGAFGAGRGFRPDPAIVELHQAFGRGKAQAGPLVMLVPGRFELREVPEKLREVLGSDARPGTDRGDLQPFRWSATWERNTWAVGSHA